MKLQFRIKYLTFPKKTAQERRGIPLRWFFLSNFSYQWIASLKGIWSNSYKATKGNSNGALLAWKLVVFVYIIFEALPFSCRRILFDEILGEICYSFSLTNQIEISEFSSYSIYWVSIMTRLTGLIYTRKRQLDFLHNKVDDLERKRIIYIFN